VESNKAHYLFFDVETNGPSPTNNSMFSIGMVITDKDHNILGEKYSTCHIDCEQISDNYIKPKGKSVIKVDKDNWPMEAQNVHKITWREQLTYQHPIDMCREIYSFIAKFDSDLVMVFHANTPFDIRFLMNHFFRWTEKGYYLIQKFIKFDRYEGTMQMAREYVRNGKDIFKQSEKLQKTIDKMQGYLTRERKTPASPAKVLEWKQKKDDAILELSSLNVESSVSFDGVSLDKICRALEIPLDHHNAMSDAKALVPIHKFLKANL